MEKLYSKCRIKLMNEKWDMNNLCDISGFCVRLGLQFISLRFRVYSL